MAVLSGLVSSVVQPAEKARSTTLRVVRAVTMTTGTRHKEGNSGSRRTRISRSPLMPDSCQAVITTDGGSGSMADRPSEAES